MIGGGLSRIGVTYLRDGSDTPNLDVSEPEIKETIDRLTVFIESSCDSYRVRELLAPQLTRESTNLPFRSALTDSRE